MLGQLLDALERKGLAGNTLVIATADNGAANRPYLPLRGSKSSIHEGGHRVPFLARWPGKIAPGSVSDATICLNDLMATGAEIVGAKLPANAGEDSVSILPVLLGTAKTSPREATIHQSPKRDLALRQGPWKLVFTANGKRELYDLKSDLGETKDLAATHPEVVERLAALMRKQIADGRSTPGAPQKNESPLSVDSPPPGKKKKTAKSPGK
jgi:arylsulfatase A-like enzyme